MRERAKLWPRNHCGHLLEQRLAFSSGLAIGGSNPTSIIPIRKVINASTARLALPLGRARHERVPKVAHSQFAVLVLGEQDIAFRQRRREHLRWVGDAVR